MITIDPYKRFSALICGLLLMLVLQGSSFAESNYTMDYSTYLGGDVVDETRDVYIDESDTSM